MTSPVWTYQGSLVGQLPVCTPAENFCVSRCHEMNVKVEACCESGVWDTQKSVEVCPAMCDQVDAGIMDSATCDVEAWGFADTGSLDSVPFSFNETTAKSASGLVPQLMPNDLKVVFLGDGDTGRPGSFNVYAAASAWDPDFVVYNADLDYKGRLGNPDQWISNFEDYFGDTPLFATIGNHDSCMWFEETTVGRGRAWETVLAERYERLGQSDFCQGTIGVANVCNYKGLLMVESGIGETSGQNDAGYVNHIEESLGANPDWAWKLCSWHKNQRELQLCTKGDSIGYEAYETCRKFGAIINNAHEHSYSRSHTMNSFASDAALEDSIVNTDNDVTVSRGETFMFTNGLAGSSIRNECDDRGDKPWWASWVAGNGNKGVFGDPSQGGLYGWMACTFKPNGEANRADCFFEDTRGNRFDEFSIRTEMNTCPGGTLDACLIFHPSEPAECAAVC